MPPPRISKSFRRPLLSVSTRSSTQWQYMRTRLYHSYDTPSSSPFPPAESKILCEAYKHIASSGFTLDTLKLGTRDAGYLDISTNLFPRSVFDLIKYHLVTQRLALQVSVQFPDAHEGQKPLGVRQKVRTLMLARLRANEKIIHRWQEALAVMAQPTYIPPSLSELAALADEIWFLAGDQSVDTSWYTKRATLSAIYAAAEVYMTQDQSKNFTETEAFLDHRLEGLGKVGGFMGGLGEWMGYTGHSVVNVLRSKGIRV